MSLTSRLFGIRAPATATSAAPSVATGSVGYTTPGLPQTPRWDGSSAISVGYYGHVYSYRCARTIASTIAGLPFRAGRDPDSPGSFNPNAPLAQLLGPPPGGPAPGISPRALWTWSIVSRLVTGRYAWETVTPPGQAQVISLWPLVAARLKPYPTDSGVQMFSRFDYQLNAQTRPLRADQVFYSWRPSQDDWREPESVLQAAALPLSAGIALDKYMTAFLRNNMVGSKLVVTPSWDDPQMRRAFQDQFLSEMTGVDNAGRVGFAEYDDTQAGAKPDVQVVDLSTTPADAQLPEMLRYIRDVICDAYGVPVSIVGQASERTYANADQEHRNFWTGTILPLIHEIADDVNMTLAPRLGEEVGWFDLSRVEALQPAHRFAQASPIDLVTAGIVTVAEVREDMTLPPELPATGSAPPVAAEPAVEDTPGAGTGGAGLGGRAAYDISSTAAMVAVFIPRAAAERITVPGGVTPADMHVTLAFLGNDLTAAQRRAAEDITVGVARQFPALTGKLSGLGHFATPNDQGTPYFTTIDVPGLERLREAVVAQLTAAKLPVSTDHGFTPHVTLTYVKPGETPPQPVKPTPVTFTQLTFAYGEARTSATFSGASMGERYDVSPLGPSMKPWIAKVGGLPLFIRAVAHALIRDGHSESQAIQLAVGVIQNWARGGGQVTAKTRAKAAAALAEWEAKKAASHAKPNRDGLTETSSAAALLPAATSVDMPHLPVAGGERGKCKLCGRPVKHPLHMTAMGAAPRKRHAGTTGHLHVPTGHASARRRSTLAAVHRQADSLEPSLTKAMTGLFTEQEKATVARLTGRRGSRMIRAAGDEPTPPVDAGQVFDLNHWAERTRQVLDPVMAAASSIAEDRLRAQFGHLPASLTAVTQALHDRAARLADTVSRTTLDQLAAALSQGIAAGESIGQLTQRVRQVFTDARSARAPMIARTETVGALNTAADTYAQSLPSDVVAGKEWISAHDTRVRHAHREADGQVRATGEPFLVAGFPLQHPGDPAGPPELTVNCRCVTGYLTPAQYAQHTQPAVQAA